MDWDDAADWADGLDLLALMTWPGAAVPNPPFGRRPESRPGPRVLSATGRDLTAGCAGTPVSTGPARAGQRRPGALPELRVPVRLGGPLGRAFGVCANSTRPTTAAWCPSTTAAVRTPRRLPRRGPFAGAALAAGDPGYDLVDAAGVSLADTVSSPSTSPASRQHWLVAGRGAVFLTSDEARRRSAEGARREGSALKRPAASG